jgi:alpha-D-ribose 1-methylphosphonate 5-triphosphate synthase subunit PhnG
MTTQIATDTDPRRLALNALAAADADALTAAWSNWADKPDFKPVRGPETGLVMVRGRAGGGGAPFNLGEASVSRATVRLDSGEIGHGYCLGRDLDKARLIAVFDALFQRDPASVETQILAPLRAGATAADLKRKQQTAATRVNFFTMVRGDN